MTNQFYATIKNMEDILRNGVSKLTVNDAFQEITNLLLLKLIEKDIISGKINELSDNNDGININEECILSNIHNKYCINYSDKIHSNTIKKGELYNLLYNEKRHVNRYYNDKLDAWIEKDTEDYTKLCVFKKIFHHKELSDVYSSSWKKYFKFEESHEIDIVKCICKLIDGFNIDINNNNSDLLGDAFEKYRDGIFGNKSGLGQYFTSQYIVEKILNEVELKPTDKLYDPACGAGGFFIKANKYIKEKYNDNNWAKNNVFGHEVDPNIFKVLQLNSYIYGFKFNNFKLCDSITNKDSYKKNNYDVLAYNPPFGASFESNSTEMFPIKIKNSVGLFLQLGFKALKDDGRCGVVVDQGIINNGTEKTTCWEAKIRKELLKNGLKKIVLLPTGAFQYTNFAICILIYDKTYKDKKIIYEEGYFIDEDKGTRIKPMYFKNIGEITYQQVEKNKYSLKYNDYFKIEDSNKQDTTGWVKLGDVCEIQFGTRITKGKNEINKTDPNAYPVYGGGDITFYTNNYNRDEENIVISRFGVSPKCVRIICGKFFLNDSGMSINILDKTQINKNYIKYYLMLNQLNIYNNYASGNAQKNIETEKLKRDFKIPNLVQEHQEEIVKFLDEYFSKHNIDEFNEYLGNFNVFKLLINKNYGLFDKLQSYILMIKATEELIKDQSDWKHENKKKYLKQIKQGYNIINVYNNNQSIEDMNFIFNNMIKTIITLENILKMKNLQIQSIFQSYRQQCEMKKLGDIVKFDIGGTPSTKENKYWNGNILWVSISDLNGSFIIDTNKKITQEGINNSSVKLIKKGSILVSFKLSFGKIGIANSDMYCNEAIMFFKHNNDITNKYLYYWFHFNDISKYASGQIGSGNLNKTSLYNIKIQVPPLDIQEEIIKRIELLEHKSSHYNQYAEILQSELNNIMEIIDNMTIACKDNELLNDTIIDESNESNDETFDESNDETIDESNDELNELINESIIDESNNEDIKELNKTNKKKSKKIQTIEYKKKIYILEDNKVYKIDNDGNKDKQYGIFIDGKVKKLKSEEKEISI
jgi:type I restriction-modification system DNA methylase subunit